MLIAFIQSDRKNIGESCSQDYELAWLSPKDMVTTSMKLPVYMDVYLRLF